VTREGSIRRREWRNLGLVLLLALALRLALFWVLPRESLVSDEPEYLASAAWLAQGRGFSFFDAWPWLRPPLYLIFLAPSLRLFGLDLTPIRLLQVALSLLVPALVYLLARTVLGRRVALPAGILAALWLPLAVLPHLVLAENLFLPLLLASVWCLVRYEREHHWGWLLAGGGLLGLATLTRGMTVGFLPLAGLWAVVRSGRWKGWRTLLPGVLLVGTALLVILPWSAYTSLRYGRPILVDTTGGYNFWLGTQGGQFDHPDDVHRALLELPDPAARQTYGYRQGWAAIAADPGGFLRGRFTEVGQLLRINYSADERLVDGFVLGDVSVPHLLALFLLEDTPYMFLVPLAFLGMLLRRETAGRGMILLWLGYSFLMAVILFSISRFRLSLLPFLTVYAAAALVERPWRRESGQDEGDSPPRAYTWRGPLVAGLLTVFFWSVVLLSYVGPYPASLRSTLLGLRGRRAAAHLARAEQAISAGDLAGAEQHIEAALSYRPDGLNPVGTAQVAQAEWLRAQGDEQGALDILDGLSWYQAYLVRGDILRARGDLEAARGQFGVRVVNQRNPTAWAWAHLLPPPVWEIDLGGGLDLGLVDGFYAGEWDGEVTYRWSEGTARLRFPGAGSGRPTDLRLFLRGWHPLEESAAEVTVILGGEQVMRFVAPSEWGEVMVPLPAIPAGGEIVVTLRVRTFLPGPGDLLQTGELRQLGVMVARAELKD
jgi:4-amino-4-deoxy-L-arabinose transferase-like glycosyltransferase